MGDKLKELTEEEALKGLEDTAGRTDPDGLYLRLAYLLRLNRHEEVLALLDEKRGVLFHRSPLNILELDLSLRLLKQDYEGARKSLEEFRELPYESQEVEEALRDAEKAIEDAERDAAPKPPMGLSEIHLSLQSHDPDRIAAALDAIPVEDLLSFKRDLSPLLVDLSLPLPVRSLTLACLALAKDGEEVPYDDGAGVKIYVPKDLPLPYQSVSYRQAAAYFLTLKDLSVGRLAAELLAKLEINRYPTGPFAGAEWADATLGIAFLAADYLMAERPEPSSYPKGADPLSAERLSEEYDRLLRADEPGAEA